MIEDELQRFIKYIDLDILTGCWIWTGSLNTYDYGKFWLNNKTVQSHTVSYNYWKGKIPKGLQLDHLCRNRQCCNPNHLELVTSLENTKRGRNHNSEKTHCINGHEFTDKNTYIKNDRREYRKCSSTRCKDYYKRTSKRKNRMKQLTVENKNMQDYDFVVLIDQENNVIQRYKRVRD